MSNIEPETQRGENTQQVDYDRLSLGIDIGTSHCEVISYGKRLDENDEEKYHYSSEPMKVSCTSSLILFAKDNESSIGYLTKFLKAHNLPAQEEYINGAKTPYIFFEQMETLIQNKEITPEDLDILRRSTNTHYPIKTKKSEYTETEKTVIRLNIELCLKPYLEMGLPLDIAFAKPCEAGSEYDAVLREITSVAANKNETYDNRFMIRSEAVFTGHYLVNMLNGSQGTIAVCDIGAGTGDVYIFDHDDSKTKVMKTFTFAGNMTTQELIKMLKEHSDVDISEREANQLKEKYGFISGYNSPKVIKPVLVDLYVQGKRRKVRSGKSLDACARPLAHEAVKTIMAVFKEYQGNPPRSIALTGFQGQLDGLDQAIEEGLRLEGYEVNVFNLRSFNENDPRSIVGKGAENYSRSLKNENWTSL